MSDVTHILQSIEDGDPQAAGELLPLVYEELRKLAAARIAHEKPGQTLQATALVHEAYVRLVESERRGSSPPSWSSRGHFFAAAAEAMRRILIEQARKRGRREALRGAQVPLEQLALGTALPNEDLLRLDEALQRLEARNPRAAQLVKLRFFAGTTTSQAADALGIPLRTAERDWTYARTWLHRELEKPDS